MQPLLPCKVMHAMVTEGAFPDQQRMGKMVKDSKKAAKLQMQISKEWPLQL